MQKNLKIVLVVVLCVTVGYLSGLVTRESILTWYVTLNKPSFEYPLILNGNENDIHKNNIMNQYKQ